MENTILRNGLVLGIIFLLLGASVVLVNPTVKAGTTVYANNRLGWESDVGSYDEEFFTDATLNPGVSVVTEYPGYVDISKGVWWDRLVVPSYGETTTTWQFATPIIGFGGNWNPGEPGGPGASIAVEIDGSWTTVGEIPCSYTGQFWGFVSTTPFSAVRLHSGSTPGAWCETYELDNMVYSTGGGPQLLGYKLTTAERGLFIRSERDHTDDNNKIILVNKNNLLQIIDHEDNGKTADDGLNWWYVKYGTSPRSGIMMGWCAEDYIADYEFPQNPKEIQDVEVTAYIRCIEEELEEKAVNYPEIWNPTGEDTIDVGTFNRAFLYSYDGVPMQGSGKFGENRLLKCITNGIGWIEENGKKWIADEDGIQFYEKSLWAQSPYDITIGASGFGISAWHVVAVDPDVIPPGSIIYLDDFKDLTLSNGIKLDGYFVAEDSGGGINGNHIDIFVGTGNDAIDEWNLIQNKIPDKIDPDTKHLSLDIKYDKNPMHSNIKADVDSPVELRVYDSRNNITGVIDGNTRIEIPHSTYDFIDETVRVYFPTDSYRYEVEGNEEGTYNLSISFIENDGSIDFNAINIPINVNSKHQYIIDWDAISQDEEGVTIQIDKDADGIFERTITSDSELSQDEFLLLTATTIDIDPNTLNRNSSGQWITCYIELPEDFDVQNIDINSIMFNSIVPAQSNPTNIGDYDYDGIPDLMVKFSRSAVGQILQPGDNVEIKVSGTLVSGIEFEGVDYIKVI